MILDNPTKCPIHFKKLLRPSVMRVPWIRRQKSNCDSSDVALFQQLRSRTKLRTNYVKRTGIVASLQECERLCLQEKQFQCLSFNFMPKFQGNLLNDIDNKTVRR